MAYKLVDFLVSLADSNNLKAYSQNSEDYMTLAGLSEEQKLAVRKGDLYRIRRYSAMEMEDSLHGQLLTRFYEEVDPAFQSARDFNSLPETDADHDVDVDTNHDHGVDMTDLGDDIAEFSKRYSTGPYYDHLFNEPWIQRRINELVVIGSGITGANHLTAEAIAYIINADKLLYCVADLAVERRLKQLNKSAEDLYVYYGDEKPRKQTYEEMVHRIIEILKSEPRVCVVFYGHPGIFVWPSFKAIELARKDGYRAWMLPAVSSLDCLFADVGFDPSRHGCQIIEATDLLVRSKKPDLNAALVIFQAGCVGDLGYNSRGYDGRNVPVLMEYLISFYGEDYELLLYEAAQYPICKPRIEKIKLINLSKSRLTGITTLYFPPKNLPPIQKAMLSRLGLISPEEVISE